MVVGGEVADDAPQALRSVAEELEGVVVRVPGGVACVFGAPRSLEDHLQRAVLAALRLRDGEQEPLAGVGVASGRLPADQETWVEDGGSRPDRGGALTRRRGRRGRGPRRSVSASPHARRGHRRAGGPRWRRGRRTATPRPHRIVGFGRSLHRPPPGPSAEPFRGPRPPDPPVRRSARPRAGGRGPDHRHRRGAGDGQVSARRGGAPCLGRPGPLDRGPLLPLRRQPAVPPRPRAGAPALRRAGRGRAEIESAVGDAYQRMRARRRGPLRPQPARRARSRRRAEPDRAAQPRGRPDTHLRSTPPSVPGGLADEPW